MNFNIELVKEVDFSEFIALYKDAGWWCDEYASDTSFIPKIVTGSHLFAAAFDEEGAMIGMGRVLSDGCSDAYIQDVVVLREFHGNGVGSEIIKRLVNELKRQGVDWIGLIGEPGTKKFYNRLGFREMENHVPMKL
jgi:spermidine synthase